MAVKQIVDVPMLLVDGVMFLDITLDMFLSSSARLIHFD